MNMKRTIIILVTASIAALLLGSCGTTAEKQLRNLDSFVDKVEADAESYTDEDWESLNSEFEAMISEIEENSENMTEEEKEQALNAIGKYYGICAKKGMETVVEGGKKAMDSLIPFLKGFSDAFKDLDDSSDSD